MSTVINTNPAAAFAGYNLARTNDSLQRSLNRLSSGSRINSSYDDAGGLAVSMKMAAQVRRADAYSANIANSRSFLETQDGALKQLGSMLERMSELKALAHDVTKNSGDVDLYEKEYIELQTQFALTTTEKFNGISLFSPTTTPDPLFLKNPERGGQIQISRPALADLNTGDTLNVGIHTYSVVQGSTTWSSAESAAMSPSTHLVTITDQEEYDKVKQVVELQPNGGYWIGAYKDQALPSNVNNPWKWTTGESFNWNTFGVSPWMSGEGNGAGQYVYMRHLNGDPMDLRWDETATPNMAGYILENDGIGILDIPWSDLQSSIQQVANARAQNGAEQMRLQMEADLNATTTINLESALSRIQDVDIAVESATLARSRVLQQAGTAMLAQANQSSQSILKLIQMN
jgi:flagellin